jgi:hypothetical protein
VQSPTRISCESRGSDSLSPTSPSLRLSLDFDGSIPARFGSQSRLRIFNFEV